MEVLLSTTGGLVTLITIRVDCEYGTVLPVVTKKQRMQTRRLFSPPVRDLECLYLPHNREYERQDQRSSR